MGAPLSRPFVPSANDGSTSTMCMLSFSARCCGDEVCVLYGNISLHSHIKEAIIRSWSKGIQQEKDYFDNFSGFKVKGNPFIARCCGSTKHALRRTELQCEILRDMMSRGWSLRCTTNFKPHTKSTSFLFEEVLDEEVEPYIMAIDLEASDLLHLVGAPSRLAPIVANIISEGWGLKKYKACSKDGEFKYVFKRFPFLTNSVGESLAKSRYVLLQILKAAHNEGYVCIGGGHPQHTIEEVDTIFFARARNPEPMNSCFIFGPQKNDYLYLVDAPDVCVQVVKDAIENVWPKGLQKEDEKVEKMNAFKIKGNPWNTSGKTAIDARLTLIHIFEKFRSMGWKIYTTFDMNHNLNDNSCFMMTSCPPEYRKFMAVKLGCGNTFRLINAPENVKSAVRALMYKFWTHGLPESQTDDNPHFSFPHSLYHVQGIFCFIVKTIESLGWRLVSSADVSAKFHADKNSRYPIDVHTMFFEETVPVVPS